ncbi:hypothetical protein JZ751_001974 [Albula glossodonta]|uniref:Mannan-binding lectin serine protease 1 n=1 Tax=Albula glossodonta TaxID=121402 RepID=A0A8T2P7L8_9TELE|nr:hypothetical protein JZ751_001974 [Albula glossodonta]
MELGVLDEAHSPRLAPEVEAEQEVLATFCGKEETDTEQIPRDQVITSPRNTLSVTFRSDFSNEERFSGFEAHYSAVDVDECRDRNDEELACDHYCHNYIGGYYCSCRYGYLLHSDNRTCRGTRSVGMLGELKSAGLSLTCCVSVIHEQMDNLQSDCASRAGFGLFPLRFVLLMECSDSVFTERTGVISSSDFPRPYPKSSDCVYRIELEEGFLLNLEFDDTFDIEDHPEVTCPYDYIKEAGACLSEHAQKAVTYALWLKGCDGDVDDIGDDCNYEDADDESVAQIQAGQREIGPLCGDRSPGRIQTGTNRIQILFHSDNSGENLGWRLSYTAEANGQIEPVLPQYSFKDHVLVTCNHGYKVLKKRIYRRVAGHCPASSPTRFFTSTVQGRGVGLEQQALFMINCGAPVEIENGTVVFESPGNDTWLGSRIRYSCSEPQYHLYPSTNSTYTCTDAGVWISEELGTKLPSCQPVCGEPAQALPALLKRIVGGRSAAPGLFPWQALLMVEDVSRVPEGRWFGSGALLSESWVLTAAHVLRSHRRDASVVPVSPEHIRVYLGLHDVNSKHLAVNRTVENVILHPGFDPRNYNNDIALVKLSQSVPLTRLVMPVCLPLPSQDSSKPQPNTLGLVAGWGISNPNVSMDDAVTSDLGELSDVLQYVKLPVVDQKECQSSYSSRSQNYNITENMFCAGFFEGGRDTCLGDSGGAFVMEDPLSGRWVAQGLVSWGGPEKCGSQRVYGVYTRVSNYISWLQSYLDS